MEQTSPEFVCRMHLSKYLGSNPEVSIPDGVEIIDGQVFKGNESIKTVIFPASIKTVDWSAFKECKRLETADLSQCENIWRLGDNLFQGCKRLTQIVLPKRLEYQTAIPLQCFVDCSSLQAINLPVGVVKIDRSAFSGCSSLTHIELPDSITFIGANTFQNCTNLITAKLPSGIKAICSHLFEGCVNLTEITIPDGVEDIVYCAFKDCMNLSEVRIPNSVTDIGEDAFRGCKNLSHIYIPDSVEEIGKKAFAGCAKGFVLQSSNPKWKAYALNERLKFELIDDPDAK